MGTFNYRLALNCNFLTPFGVDIQDLVVHDPGVSITANSVLFTTPPGYESGYLVSIRWRGNSDLWEPIYAITGDAVDEGSAVSYSPFFSYMFINVNVYGNATLTVAGVSSFEESLEARVVVFPQPAF